MSAPEYLYDDDPQPLHAGAGRPRKGLLVALGVGTVAAATVAAFALPLLKGTPQEQVEEVAGVFTQALAAGDAETAWGLLCAAEQARLDPDQVAGDYLRPGNPSVGTAEAGELDGRVAQVVPVRWDDGGAVRDSELTLVAEDGAKVCAGS